MHESECMEWTGTCALRAVRACPPMAAGPVWGEALWGVADVKNRWNRVYRSKIQQLGSQNSCLPQMFLDYLSSAARDRAPPQRRPGRASETVRDLHQPSSLWPGQ